MKMTNSEAFNLMNDAFIEGVKSGDFENTQQVTSLALSKYLASIARSLAIIADEIEKKNDD